MIADAVTVRLHLAENLESVWIVVLRATAEEHVVIHVFSDTFVAVERMKFPFSVESNSQTINSESKREQDSHRGQCT